MIQDMIHLESSMNTPESININIFKMRSDVEWYKKFVTSL